MFPVQNGLICWLDAMDGKAGDTLLKDRTSYGHNLIVENFQQGYGFTGTSIKVKQSESSTSNNNALYIANGGFKTSCKSFCICIERHNTNQPWYIFDGRELDGQGSSTNHCFNGNTGFSYDNSKTRRDGVLTYNNSNLDTNKKTFLYFELREAELFTLSILMRYSKNENTEGEFYSLYAYNRALTEEEILQNMEYENNKISYVNKNNLPKIVDKLTDASNIKITGNKYGNRVQTVIDKIVEKADDVTKAIEQEVVNNSYSFKVGTGDVDISADVEDGFGEVGIKGVTYQNLIIPNSMTKPNNIIIDGDIVTLLDSHNTFEGITYKALTKKNTTYTVVLDVKELFEDGIGYKIQINDGAYLYNAPLKLGINVIKIITKENGDNYHIAILKVSTAVGTMKFSKKILLLEGDHTNNPNLPSYFEGIVGIGDKSKNLFNKDNIKQTVLNLGAAGSNCGEVVSQVRCSLRKISCKPNTKYTIKSDKEINAAIGSIGNNNIALGDSSWRNIYNSYTYTTPSDAIELAVNIAKTDNTNIDIEYVKNFNIQIEEGETATTYEPHHDGHKIEVLSQGKNLWSRKLSDYDGISRKDSNSICVIADNYIEWQSYSDNYSPSMSYHFYVEPNTEYTMSYTERSNGIEIVVSDGHIGNIYNSSKVITSSTTGSQRTFTSKSNKITFRISNLGSTGVVKISGIQLEKGSTKSSYEPYVSDKTQILLDEPLMRLPNGVCDEITRDGKLIRRVGKLNFLDFKSKYNINPTVAIWSANDSHGAYQWTNVYSKTSNLINYNYSNLNKPLPPNMICDKYPYDKAFHGGNTNGGVGLPDKFFAITNDGHARLMIAKKLVNPTEPSAITESMLKNWVEENCDLNAIFYYELAEPIITELPAPCLRIFKDGHLTFNTLVAPESNHVVQLNKSAQIQNAIKESQSLDNRINVLENNYDNLMLSTISRLNDLELNYTLK